MIIANENVYHNGVKYPHSEELDGVTLYLNDTYDVVDLAVDSDVETVTFWDPRANGIWRSIFLQDVKTSYPNVKKLIVEAGISGVNMRNALFPNVQEVEVQPKEKAPYMAGGKAKHAASHKSSVLILNGCLLNTFYQSPDSVIDLTGVNSIAPYAFSGCRTNHIVHTNQVRKIEPHAFDGFSFHARFTDHQKIMDTILMEVESDSEVQVPASVSAVNPDCGLEKARCLICSSFADVSRIRALFPALYRGVRLPKDIVIQKTAFDKMVTPDDITNCLFSAGFSQVHLELNDWYEEQDGAIYTKGQERLVSVPRSVTHFTIPDTVSVIGENAFMKCNILQEIHIPASVRVIEKHAFCNCQALARISFDEASKVWLNPSAFHGLPSLVSFQIPFGTEECHSVLAEASNLQELFLPDGLRVLERLTAPVPELSIPASLESMEQCFFPSVTDIYLHSDSVPYGFFSSLKSVSQFTNVLVQIHTVSGECYYFPKALTGDALDRLDAIASVFGFRAVCEKTAGFQDCLSDCVSKEAQALAAIELVLKTGSMPAFQIVKKSAKGIFSRFIKEKQPEASFIALVKTGALPKPVLEDVLDFAQENGMASLCAYSMEALRTAEAKKPAAQEKQKPKKPQKEQKSQKSQKSQKKMPL